MIKAYHSISKDPNSLRNQYESIKDKYIIATACFRIATPICVCKIFYYYTCRQKQFTKDTFGHQIQNEIHFFE